MLKICFIQPYVLRHYEHNDLNFSLKSNRKLHLLIKNNDKN